MQQDRHTKRGKVDYFESLHTYIHIYNPKKKKNRRCEMKLNSVHTNIQHNKHKYINTRRCEIKVSPLFFGKFIKSKSRLQAHYKEKKKR